MFDKAIAFAGAVKVPVVNGSVFGAVTVGDFNELLKAILLLVTIGWTAWQWRRAAKKDKARRANEPDSV